MTFWYKLEACICKTLLRLHKLSCLPVASCLATFFLFQDDDILARDISSAKQIWTDISDFFFIGYIINVDIGY